MTPAAAELGPLYPRLETPAFILAGAEDAIVDVGEQSARLHREVRHSELVVEPGVGHMLHYADPDLVVEAIDSVAARSAARQVRREWVSTETRGCDLTE